MQELLKIENCGGGCRSIIYKNDVLEALWRQELVANGEDLFRNYEHGNSNGDVDRFHPGFFEWLEDI